jgi:peptidoglycan hydrolase CwlO-like protein
MSNKNPKKDPAVSSDDFDPTRREDEDGAQGSESGGSGALVPRREQSPAMFADFIPTGHELSIAAHQAFGKDLPEDIIRTIVHESEEIAHSTRRIMEEHMRIGGSVIRIMARVQNHLINQLGKDTQTVRDKAAKLVYDYVEKVFRRKRTTIKNYMYCYGKFANNAEAIQILGYSDMSMLIRGDTPDDVVDMVIEARKENPDMSKLDVKKLIDGYRKAQELLTQKDTAIDDVTVELENVVGKLTQSELENRRLMAAYEKLQQDLVRNRESAEATRVAMGSVNGQITALQQQLANTERELDARTRALKEAATKVETKEVEVPTVPKPYTNLQEAIETSLAQLTELNGQIDAKKTELSALEEKHAAETAAARESEALEKMFNGLVHKFGAFVQDYHSTQLLVTANGLPTRFSSLLQALSDLVGKFHTELQTALRVA